MKLVCYIKEGQEQLAILTGETLYDMDALHPELPSSMSMFLNYWDDYFPLAKNINESIEEGKTSLNIGIPVASVALISPVPFPASCRRAVVFDDGSNKFIADQAQNKKSPSFHFINHHSIQGGGNVSCMPDHLSKLDVEVGVAMVVSSHCRNITAEEADQYIGGYMIMNKIIAHDGLLNNNVANVLGPLLVTADELESFQITMNDDKKRGLNIKVKCSINGELVSEFNLSEMHWSFAEILESCAYGAGLQPGDVIGTGSFTMGLLLDQNLTGKKNETNYQEKWLQKDDVIEIEVEGLGILKSTIVADGSDFSLLNNLI